MNTTNRKNRKGKARALSFSPLFAEHLFSRDYDFYSEADFNAMISLERKRTERSKSPFLLMLLDVKAFKKSRGRGKVMEKIAYALCSCSRKIDIKGWYKKGEIYGVVFTEIAKAGHEVREKIFQKVIRALSGVLKLDELQKVKISLHPYPEDKQQKQEGQSIFDLCLYPDLSTKIRGNRMSLVLKRIMDILGSLFALALLSPLFLAIALGVKCSSEGPILYRQTRIGLAGKQFTFLKFRSMYANSDSTDHIEYIRRYINGAKAENSGSVVGKDGIYKITDDRRVTPFGRFLRKTSLDELPQFINVLKGEMSLVGPRPPIPYECENYEIWHRRRMLEVKPGITGLWQVKGRSATVFDEMVRLDLRYVADWSIWLDLKILFQTPRTVISCKGAY
ncbi:MAG: UDP-glucose:undecaprenyl-phosphate glucose-1-phosphate transferase [Syntrophorhabdaceae bacterium PtaU1.Bin034]|nr:MAG: UDP-glucose:undecaprenyl-phosphate glucose-1-phosphate transferase [Syntrophorhabdaceae bacterium PtaU1.Bin034]